jgi:hypothetical protein
MTEKIVNWRTQLIWTKTNHPTGGIVPYVQWSLVTPNGHILGYIMGYFRK